ncbi:MAG: hypothetical protein AAGN35_09795 [Bacteroidota bacterium]
MAIDYIINRSCSTKDALGEEAIVDLVKSRVRGRSMVRMLMKKGHSQEAALAARVSLQNHTLTGERTTREVTLQQMLRESTLLDDYADHCQSCPVNLLESYGCYQRINYPISALAERWLAERAQAAAEFGLPNSILLDFIVDQKVTGEFMGQLRAHPENRFFEAKEPLGVTFRGKLLQWETVSTDQLLDMFFAVGEMELVHQQFLLLFSGGLSFQDEMPDLDRVGKDFQAGITTDADGKDQFMIFRLHNSPEDDQSMRQIKAFLRALFAAYCIGATVEVDF